jgi:hypothetical protein
MCAATKKILLVPGPLSRSAHKICGNIIDFGSSPSRCRPGRNIAAGQTWDLPTSGAFPLRVTCSWTPAGWQCLAYRPCSCCVRLFPRSPLLRHAYFVAQSQTPRNCCVRFVAGVTVGSRNTCYRAARYGLTRAGLSPAGPHQLLLAPSEIQASLTLPSIPADEAPGPGDGLLLIPMLFSVAVVLLGYCIILLYKFVRWVLT